VYPKSELPDLKMVH